MNLPSGKNPFIAAACQNKFNDKEKKKKKKKKTTGALQKKYLSPDLCHKGIGASDPLLILLSSQKKKRGKIFQAAFHIC